MHEGVVGSTLCSKGIVCWQVELAQPEHVVSALDRLLSADERARASSSVSERHRKRFTVARACLRALIGIAIGAPPGAIRFRYGLQGKPELTRETPGLHFNLSHTGDMAVIALTWRGAVGSDIEGIRPVPDRLQIAARYFTHAEADTIGAQTDAEREFTFLRCWTRKEAFAKATGLGLWMTLDRCRVTCGPDEPARILDIDRSPGAALEWSLFDLELSPDVMGAVVVRGVSPPPLVTRLDVESSVSWMVENCS